eukprot:TRINITY_DN14999_c0_g3_i2.p2 TRINITY_DN14999_c0_g3~~TRINITY_DN14999_c0_g3_i2.p2  ORF type:complete len:121 (+),score=7.08 TRINITY_DN14999_c0_g3_i2:349-711(+)
MLKTLNNFSNKIQSQGKVQQSKINSLTNHLLNIQHGKKQSQNILNSSQQNKLFCGINVENFKQFFQQNSELGESTLQANHLQKTAIAVVLQNLNSYSKYKYFCLMEQNDYIQQIKLFFRI